MICQLTDLYSHGSEHWLKWINRDTGKMFFFFFFSLSCQVQAH